MKTRSVIVVLASAAFHILPRPVPAATIRVPADQPTIQQAINVAQAGDLVLVSPGIYSGPNNQNLDFLGKDIVVASEAGPQTTIIAPISGGNGFALHSNESENARIEGFTVQGTTTGIVLNFSNATIRNCVLTGNGIGLEVRGADMNGGPFPFARIEECVLTGNGTGLRFTSASGAVRDCQLSNNSAWGIYFAIGFWGAGEPQTFDRCTISANAMGGATLPSQGGPIFRDCVISDHPSGAPGVDDRSEHGQSQFLRCTFARNAGGAYVLFGSNVRGAYFEDCLFENNARAIAYHAPRGGGVQRCRFINNSTSGSGGAILLDEGSPPIENSVFWNNTAGVVGGAIATTVGLGARSPIRGCTFVGGGAPQGGAIGTTFALLVTIERTIIAFTTSGGPLGCGIGGPPNVTCSDFFGNAGGDWTGCLDGMNGTNGNISADPRFCNPGAGDFTLNEGSPCAPEHSGTCGLIGALPVACGTTAVQPTTWGRVKATLRP